MKRNWNWALWAGFAIALAAALSYLPVFVQFAETRDLPWVNLLLFLAGGCLLATGLYRAFSQPTRYRGKISGSILSLLTLALFGLFCFGVFYSARMLPSGQLALHVGQPAPEFALAGIDGKMVTLSQLRQDKRAVLLIFYRGYW